MCTLLFCVSDRKRDRNRSKKRHKTAEKKELSMRLSEKERMSSKSNIHRTNKYANKIQMYTQSAPVGSVCVRVNRTNAYDIDNHENYVLKTSAAAAVVVAATRAAATTTATTVTIFQYYYCCCCCFFDSFIHSFIRSLFLRIFAIPYMTCMCTSEHTKHSAIRNDRQKTVYYKCEGGNNNNNRYNKQHSKINVAKRTEKGRGINCRGSHTHTHARDCVYLLELRCDWHGHTNQPYVPY